MEEIKRPSLVKPTINTHYSIDFDWWKQIDRDWRVHLRDLLCPEHSAAFMDVDLDEKVDWVDPETAQVVKVDGLQNVLINHCAGLEDFLTVHTSVVEAIFRTFVANGNTPLTVVELADRLNRPANTILRTLSGTRVYRGLRPRIH